MNIAIIEEILKECSKKSYEGEYGEEVITIENLTKILCQMYNVDYRTLMKKQ